MDFMKQMKDIAAMKSQLEKAQKELGSKIVTVSDSGVRVEMNGKLDVLSVKIENIDLLKDAGKLEAAITQALKKTKNQVEKVVTFEITKNMGGPKLPIS
ncbi:MAG: YbaB/EbfC family nucleoid-associated protein [Elusimicrobiota bacterium]